MAYEEIFARELDKYGTVDPTPQGFLALAQAGKDDWNAWRAEYTRSG